MLPLPSLSLTQLHYFYTMVQSKSMREAAEQLHISQPSLSVAIKNLEKELNLSLFVHEKKRLHLTPEGKRFYQEIKPLLMHVRKVEERITLFKEGRHRIRLGVAPMMSSFFLPLIFNQFNKEYPHIEFEIYEAGVHRLQQLLRGQELDMAFLIQSALDREIVDFTPIVNTVYHLYVGKENPLATLYAERKAKGESIHFEDYKDSPMLFYKETSYIHGILTRFFKEREATPNVLLRTSQIHMMKELARTSNAIAFLTEKAVRPEDELIPIPTDQSFPITIGVGTNKYSHRTPSMEMFIEYLEEHREEI